MTDLAMVARGHIGAGRSGERLTCHPRLPLVACSDAERPAVHIWEFGGGQLRELGSVGRTSDAYGDTFRWERVAWTPAVAWHPHQPMLVVSGESGLRRWTPAGGVETDGLPAAVSYRSLAFSPDGQTLWGSPSSRAEGDGWESSDILELASGTIGAGPRWDTGVAEHPGADSSPRSPATRGPRTVFPRASSQGPRPPCRGRSAGR